MNQRRDPRLEQRLAQLNRRPGPQPRRRASRTKVATAGASATAIVGLTALYSLASNADNGAVASAADPTAIDPTGNAQAALTASSDLTVTIDADGNVLSAPAGVDPNVVAQAVAARLAQQSSATTLAPVLEPSLVALAIPAADQTTSTSVVTDSAADQTTVSDSTATASDSAATASTTTTAATTTTTAAPAASSSSNRRAPQAKSSGS